MLYHTVYHMVGHMQHRARYNGDYIWIDLFDYVYQLVLLLGHRQTMKPPIRRRIITKTRLYKYIENFTTKSWKFSDKNYNIFHISAQNTDCGYSLEPPRRGGSNEYPQSMSLSRNNKNNVYPCKPQFYYIKVGFKGVNII